MGTFKILFLLTAVLFSGKKQSIKNETDYEYLTYCTTDKWKLCNWTPYIGEARLAARNHLTPDRKDHHIELWQRVTDPEHSNDKRRIKIIKLNNASLINIKIRNH